MLEQFRHFIEPYLYIVLFRLSTAEWWELAIMWLGAVMGLFLLEAWQRAWAGLELLEMARRARNRND